MQGNIKTFRTGSQCAKILAYLQTGQSLTVAKARELKFGDNLRSRISDLKNAGHNIESNQINFDGGFVAEYSLVQDEVKEETQTPINEYINFIKSKKTIKSASGFTIKDSQISNHAFDYQAEIIQRSVYNGRYALFMDTGLGKSICQLNFSQAVLEHTNKPTLILAPLAVVYQLEKEAAKFDFELNRINKNNDIKKCINITNYDNLKNIDTSKFNCIDLDESSILKNYTGKLKNHIIGSFKHCDYKLACTATPSPNDYLELGNHSEFLDVMESYEMIMRYFINDTMKAGGYRLKGHAETEYWKWIASWAECITNPSDLGYDGSSHILPNLNEIYHEISHDDTKYCDDGFLFSFSEQNATTLAKNKKDTLEKRVNKLLDYLNDEQHLIWVDTNEESEFVKKIIPDCVEVKGSDKDEYKAEMLNAFADGKIKRLITKTSIAGMGMNFQSSNNMTFLGLNYSYEKFYQAVRRMWRYGQKNEVNCNILVADNEVNILKSIHRKKEQHDKMKAEMQKAIIGAKKANILTLAQSPKITLPIFV